MIDDRLFYLCDHCRFVFTPKTLSSCEEKQHYESQHLGEYDWLTVGRVCLKLAGMYKDPADIRKILDYGAGAGYLTDSLRLHGFQVDSYEPMYDGVLSVKTCANYDLVILHEVIEHIDDIHGTFKSIYDLSGDNAVIIIVTCLTDNLLHEECDFVMRFNEWWDKNDKTLISFFSSRTFCCLCHRTGQFWLKLLSTFGGGVVLQVCKQAETGQRC